MIDHRFEGIFALAIALSVVALPEASAQESVATSQLNPPPQAMETIKVRPGFHLQLAASEPMVSDPVAAAFDENGRLFVIEYPQYNEDWAKANSPRRGRVRLLVDEDDDGVFDKVTTFVDELDNPMSLACWDGGLYVGASPDLLYYRDTDGDGIADEKRVAFTGFGQETNRAGYAQLNSFIWGLDNRYHACTNYSGGDVRKAGDDEDSAQSVRNRGFVFDPRDESFDTESGGGQHGMCFDDWGNLFTCRNSDPVQLYFYDDRRLRGNDYLQAPSALKSILDSGKYTSLHRLSPDEEWRVIRTRRRVSGEFKGPVEGGGKVSGYFTAATGVTIYRGDAWPAKYRGSALVGEASNNLVFRADLEADGVGFVAKRGDEDALGVEFIASTDNAFRPVQFAHAPDGNLLMLDMYRGLIEGAGFLPPDVVEAMEVLGGSGMGRIYRIVADGTERRATPRLGEKTSTELVALLAHKNAWHRETAARLLYERKDPAVEPLLRKMAVESASPLGRVHAAWALRGMGVEIDDGILTLIIDPVAEVREQAVILSAERIGSSPTLAHDLQARLADVSQKVRYAVALELDGIADPAQRSAAIAAVLQIDGDDEWMRLAAMSSLRGDAGRVAKILADADQFIPGDLAPAKPIFQELARQLGERAELDAEAVSDFVGAIEVVATKDASLARSIIGALIETRQGKALAEEMTHAGGEAKNLLAAMLSSAQAIAFDAKRSDAERATAIQRLRLRGFDEFRAQARKLLDSSQSGAVQAAAIDTLGGFAADEVGDELIAAWKGLAPAARERALTVVMRRKAWVAVLLDAVEAGAVTRADLGATRIAALSQHSVDSIRTRAEQVFAAGAFAARDEVVARYQPALQAKGDPTRGKAVFATACAACHQVDGVGQAIGAELTGIMNRGAEAVLLNILDPNREVHADFLLYSVELKDGAVETGMIRSESSSAVTLRRIDGSEVEMLRIDIGSIASLGMSFMPEGLEAAISVEAMADLLAFLKSVE